MIIYLDEDSSYLSWVAHHREGYVVDWLRKPTRRHPILHRAACAKVRAPRSKKTHLTTGRHLKACSSEIGELVRWAEHQTGHAPEYCQDCSPGQQLNGYVTHQLTRLEREILDCVIEVAVIHLDSEDSTYSLSAQDVAEYLDKTTGQISAALLRLIHAGDLRIGRTVQTETDLLDRDRVYPTSQSLRRLPAFEEMSTLALGALLRSLTGEVA